MFKNEILLITGGTGSFGNAVLNLFLHTEVKEIRIFSRDELKQDEMRQKYRNDKLKFYIGDVRDSDSIYDSMAGVDYVFHAAALKQVPSCEFYPMEAVKTNVIGTENVLNACVAMGVKKVVVLSTDKAVYPINAMGISKALMEKVTLAKARTTESSGCTMSVTRYGNVMASRGSVIPLFIEQIKRGQAITITDPDMTRFLMSLDEAVHLVLHAYEHGKSGDIFVQKSPASTVADLAEAIRQIFDSQTKIKIIGTRHGEKKYETLLTREEMVKAQEGEKYFRIPSDERDLNYDKYYTEGKKQVTKQIEEYNSYNTKMLNVKEIIDLLLKLDYVKNELKRK
ncbi:TPA: UDP-glucose 4-epimerase [candidate division WOR-3 bacterium]|uniref:UDP-glucose 4-epimerase n=1 Tax=candidate division WOR-3 bacterium TaxID=2052148 RepID=A0A350HBH9_UNCW3|nr:UDP-glucose 4-epimerase [candidate division WOR-3 bacterium]